MIKKALYIVASSMFALLLTIVLVGYNFVMSMQSHIAADIHNENYTSAEKYYAIALDENKFFTEKLSDGTTYLEVFPAVNANTAFVTISGEGETEATTKSYTSYESSIQFSIFNISSEFDMENDSFESKNGKIVLTVSDKTVEFPFYKTEMSSFYTSYGSYQYFTICVFYDEFATELEKLELPATTAITKAEIYDGKKVLRYTVEFPEGKQPSFDTKFHEVVDPLCDVYNLGQKEYITDKKEITTDLIQLKNNIITEFEKYTEEKFVVGYEINVILTSVECLLPTGIGLLCFIVIDLGLAYFLFRKKKRFGSRRGFTFGGASYGRKAPNQTVEAPKTEQFSRDVFNYRDEILADEIANTTNNVVEEQTDTVEKVEE